MRYQQVKYKMINNDLNSEIWLDNDPKNWDESDKTLKRSTKFFGVYTELSKNFGIFSFTPLNSYSILCSLLIND